MSNAEAWLVVARDGFRAVFIDEAQAMNYAVRCHGVAHPMVRQVGDSDGATATKDRDSSAAPGAAK